MKELILKYALYNAIKYGGKAQIGAIIGKVIAENPKVDKKKLAQEVQKIVKEVNALKPTQQMEQLKKLAPELLEEKPKEEHDLFAFLNIQPKEKIVTAFPPEPSKYPHIGHAKALLLNYELAHRHKGTFYLRFEDTNPKLAKQEFYDIHLKDYAWLGVQPDKIVYVSDHLDEMYRAAEKLIAAGHAYVCECVQDIVKEKRAKGEPCAHRSRQTKENQAVWRSMLSEPQPGTTLRLKGDLSDHNTAFRDPTLFRTIVEEHPRTKHKFHLWPTYDFENAAMDGIMGVTHRLRSKEFELRNKVQQHIQKLLGFTPTKIYEFARFNLEGVESSGRIIREKIEHGELLGWDDPSLTTLHALRRRGFTPEAVKEFVLSTGMSKAGGTLTWDDLYAKNRSVLDPQARRFFFVENPQKVTINNAPKKKVKLPSHPQKDLGHREMKTNTDFYVEDKVKKGTFRFMHLFNFKDLAYLSEAYDQKLHAKLVHWLPASDDLVNIEVLMPDKTLKSGLGEPTLKTLKEGTVVQFERKFFARFDRKEKDVYVFYFTHT